MHSLIQWIRRAWEPGEISLRTYLLIGLLARLPAIFFSRGYDFLDHQFQYVDPAYHIGLGGSWWQSHDYVQGLRSWVYPGLLGGMFKFLSWLGLTDPNTMMTATRFCHGLIGLVPLAAFWTLIVRWKGWTGQRPLLLFMACNALVVYSGVQPTGPTFSVGLVLTSIFIFHGPGRVWPFCSGLLLGLAFACRFQDAFFWPVLFAAGIAQKRWSATLFMSAGAAITATLQGLVDLFTWGGFLHSPFRYVAWNVFEGAARRYGDQPVWFYIPFILLVLFLVPPFVRSGFAALAEGGRKLPILLAASGFYLLMHQLVARKAFRFVLGALILLLLVYASALLVRKIADSRYRRWHRHLFVGVHVLALVLASFWYPQRGPVEAALTLSRRDDFVDRLVIVDGAADALGGHYYLRRDHIEVHLVERSRLVSWIRENRPETPLYFLVVRRPLAPIQLPDSYRLESEGYFRDWPDLKRNTRRYLYRLRKSH